MPTFEEVEPEPAEPERAEPEPVVTPLTFGTSASGGKKTNRPRVPSIEEVTDQELFGDIDPPEPEPAERSLKDKANDIVKQKDFDGAAALYTEALAELEQDDPQRLPLLSNLALCMLKLKQWKECVDAASQALEFNADHTKALFRRGQARRELGELTAARSDMERSLETAPPALAPSIRTALAEVNGMIMGTAGPALPPEFQPSESFGGPREGYEFKKGPQGMGYYSTAGGKTVNADEGLSYEQIMERRKRDWKEKTGGSEGKDEADDGDESEDGEAAQGSAEAPKEQEEEAKWKVTVREGWGIVVSSAIPQVVAIGLWIGIVCGVSYLRREQINLGGPVSTPAAGLSLGSAFGGLTEVGTIAGRTTAIGLVSGAPAGGALDERLTVVATTRETLDVWDYSSAEAGGSLELSDEASFHLQPEEEDTGLVTAAAVFSWPGPSQETGGLANWAVVAGFSGGGVRLYRGGVAQLRTQQRVDEYLPPTAELQVLPVASKGSKTENKQPKQQQQQQQQQLTAVAAIAIDSTGVALSESKSAPAYHLIAALAQDLDTCTESQQRLTCAQRLHVLSWEPETGSLSLIGSSVPPVGKSNTIAFLTPYAAGRPGFVMLDVTGKVMVLSGVPRSQPEAQASTALPSAGKDEAEHQNKDKDVEDDDDGFFKDDDDDNDGSAAASGDTGSDGSGGSAASALLKIETCTTSATPTPFGDSAGLTWAVDPLWPNTFYTMHWRGSRKVSSFHIRLDAIGDAQAGKCHSRAIQSVSTPEPPASALRRVCPMHGYLVGLGESVSLWNVTGSSGGREQWSVLIGGKESKSEGLSGKYSEVGKVLQHSEDCRAAIVGQHEWLLLEKPLVAPQAGAPGSSDGAGEKDALGQMGKDEYLQYLNGEGGTISEKAAGSSFVLVRSSLPFEHVSYDLKFMIYAVGIGVVCVSVGWHVNYARQTKSRIGDDDKLLGSLSKAAKGKQNVDKRLVPVRKPQNSSINSDQPSVQLIAS